MAASQPFHARSISLPSRDHPSILKTEEELRKLRSFMAQSSLTSLMIVDGLKGLGGLYECINELLHSPSSNQHFSSQQQKKWMEVELADSIKLLELIGAILSDKKLLKNIQNCFRSLKHMDEKDAFSCTGGEQFGPCKASKILKEVRLFAISLLQFVFNFLSLPRPKTKTSRWSLISKALQNRKVTCEGEYEDVKDEATTRYQLQMSENSIRHLEEGLDSLYRSIIQNRVAFLNFFSL